MYKVPLPFQAMRVHQVAAEAASAAEKTALEQGLPKAGHEDSFAETRRRPPSNNTHGTGPCLDAKSR